jgi:pimeloyl-ACP methyl ester carboxylesterase
MTETAHLLGQGGAPIGILARPEGPSRSDVAVIFLNSGLLHRIGPFRLYVELSRQLARQGVVSLRLDQSGKGDSDRRKGLSFAESIDKDFEDASAFLRSTVGARRFVLIGLCSGADDGLYLASKHSEVAGAVLLEPYAARTPKYYIRHYAPRVLQLRLWVIWAMRIARLLQSRAASVGRKRSPADRQTDMRMLREFPGRVEMRRRFQAAVDRGAKLLCVFTEGSRSYYNYRGQLVEGLQLSGGGGDLITELYRPWAKHTYPLVSHRQDLIEHVCRWLGREFGAPHETAAVAGSPRGEAEIDTRERAAAR